MEDMLEKAEAQASEQQKAEMTAAHNFAMLKQGLEDAMNNAAKELSDAKKAKGAAEETKAEAEGELERTNKAIADNQKSLKDLQHECMTTAEAYEQESHERQEELGALAAATKIIQEKTGGAADRAYSFVQAKTQTRSRSQLRLQVAGDKVVALLQQLSRAEKQQALAHLEENVDGIVDKLCLLEKRAALQTAPTPMAAPGMPVYVIAAQAPPSADMSMSKIDKADEQV